MNYALIKFSIQKIIKQPLTILIFFLQAVFIILLLFINLNYTGSQVTSIIFFGLSFDEPYLVNQVSSNIFSLYFFTLIFLLVLISCRFYYEFINDPLLNIILPKLKKKSTLIFSTAAGVSIIFLVSFLLIIIFANVIFMLRFNMNILFFTLPSVLTLLLIITYIVSSSLVLTQLFDGFSASVVIVIPLLFGEILNMLLSDKSILLKMINFLFPLGKLNSIIVNTLMGGTPWDISIWGVIILNTAFIFGGINLFRKKWR